MRKSTGLDRVFPDARRKALGVAAGWTQKEMAAPRSREIERWETWAGTYIEGRYAGTGSLKTARLGLSDAMAYFSEHSIRTPRQVTHEVASDFVPWRLATKTLGKVGQNTARLRFVYLGVLMGEAVRRRFADFNPCREIRTKRLAPKEKKEISPEDEARIIGALAEKPSWMREQWLVLMRQGCRVSETAVPLERIDTKSMTITFRLKGGKLHPAALHSDLLPLVAQAKKEGRRALVEGPPVGSWSPIWSDFFKRRGFPYSIHCTRVTVITRLVREGGNLSEICNFIGHSEAVNRIYRKLKPADSRSLLDILATVPNRPRDSATP